MTQEANLIAVMLRDSAKVMAECAEAGISDESFSNPDHAEIYRIVTGIQAKGGTPDRYALLSVAPESLHAAIAEIPTDAYPYNSPVYVAGVVTEWRNRRLRGVAAQIECAIEEECDPADTIGKAQSVLCDILSTGGSKIKTIASLKDQVLQRWELSRKHGYIGVPSVFPALNNYIGGYRPGVMTVLGGYRGEGKSTLARCEAKHTAQNYGPVGVLTPEDSADTVAAGIVGNHGDFSTYALDTGTSHKTIDEVRAAWDDVQELPIYIIDSPQTITDIVSNMTLLKAKYGIKLGVIDHLQYIIPNRRYESRNAEISYYSGQIAALARRLDIPIIVLSQLSRDAEKTSRKPKLSDLRDSGAIEQDARLCLLLYFDATTQTHTLEVAKQNYGPSCKCVQLVRVDGRQRFEEYHGQENTR